MTENNIKNVKVDKILIYLLKQKIEFEIEMKKIGKNTKYIKDFKLEEALKECEKLVFLWDNLK